MSANRSIGLLLGVALACSFPAACGWPSSHEVSQARLVLSQEDAMLRINVYNETDSEIIVPANFLDGSRDHELSLIVVSSEGDVRPMCDGIDYVHGLDRKNVAPGGSVEIVVPISAVQFVYCLEKGAHFEARAVLKLAPSKRGMKTESSPVTVVPN